MAWTAPMTAVANTIFTASQFNQFVRDNLNETAPAKVTAASRYLVSTGANAIAQRECFLSTTLTSESTATTTYTDLATAGPTASVNCGSKCLVFITARTENSLSNSASYVGYEISGATSRAATDNEAIEDDGRTAANSVRWSVASLATGLTPGVNNFTLKYRAGSGTATFASRQVIVFPF